jgi:hypothetical protein
VSPLDEPRLTEATEAGYCAISGEHDDDTPLTLDPVTVYGLAASRTDAERARLASLRPVVRGIRSSVSRPATLDPDRSLGHATVERESVEDMALTGTGAWRSCVGVD